jgi:pyruvate kinase
MIEKAKKLLQDAYYDERGMSDSMRADAAVCAQIAQTEALNRIADALEKLSMCVVGDGDLRVYIPDAISVQS